MGNKPQDSKGFLLNNIQSKNTKQIIQSDVVYEKKTQKSFISIYISINSVHLTINAKTQEKQTSKEKLIDSHSLKRYDHSVSELFSQWNPSMVGEGTAKLLLPSPRQEVLMLPLF